jgi:hypothetical protein
VASAIDFVRAESSATLRLSLLLKDRRMLFYRLIRRFDRNSITGPNHCRGARGAVYRKGPRESSDSAVTGEADPLFCNPIVEFQLLTQLK